MRTYQLQDFANPISVAVTNPSQSGYSRFVGLEHYDSGELVVKRYSGTELLTTTAKAFETNDILIARRNVYLKRAGIVFFDGITSGDTIVLRIKNDCESATGVPKDLAQRIIPIVLNSEHFWIYANKHADGMNSKRISKEMLLTYEFELPSLEEQRVLADKLWAAYEVKESYKNLLAQTDKLLHAQFEKMFGNLLTNSLNLPTQKMSEVAPEIPSSKEQSGQVWQLNLDMIESKSGKIISKVYIDKDDVSSSTTAFDATNVLYSKLRPNLNKVVVPDESGYCTTELLPLKPNAKLLDRVFLATLLRNEEFVQWAINHSAGTKMPRVSLSAFREFRIIIPPMEKQLEFVRIAEQAERTKASLNKGIEAIEAVIRSLIAEGTTKV